MKLDITDIHFMELQKKGYTIDMVLILNWINKNLSIEHIVSGSKKIDILYKSMKRKGLVTDDDKLSKIGIEILDFISLKSNKILIKPKPIKSDFDEWWNIFPSNDKFMIKNKEFGPTRAFKTKKEDCRIKFNKMILDGEFTAKQIINATLYDINLKKERSFKKNSNQLKYLQNSHTYLYQKTFSGFVDMEVITIKKVTKMGSIDI